MDIKSRMAELGMKQVDMIMELRKRGIVVQPPMMSSVLRGVYTYPKQKAGISSKAFQRLVLSTSTTRVA